MKYHKGNFVGHCFNILKHEIIFFLINETSDKNILYTRRLVVYIGIKGDGGV